MCSLKNAVFGEKPLTCPLKVASMQLSVEQGHKDISLRFTLKVKKLDTDHFKSVRFPSLGNYIAN